MILWLFIAGHSLVSYGIPYFAKSPSNRQYQCACWLMSQGHFQLTELRYFIFILSPSIRKSIYKGISKVFTLLEQFFFVNMTIFAPSYN